MLFGRSPLGSCSYIIAGLGNPDKKYENTRHNAGFIAVDYIAEKCGVKLDRLKYKSYCAQAQLGDTKVLLMKPMTYMNNSGQALVEAMNFYKIPPENAVIIFDDISLDVGKLRIRRKGSDGGQKGMRSIIYLSGSDAFPRIKIGTGAKPEGWELANWVLSQFSDSERKLIDEASEKAYKAAELIVSGDINKAMNFFN